MFLFEALRAWGSVLVGVNCLGCLFSTTEAQRILTYFPKENLCASVVKPEPRSRSDTKNFLRASVPSVVKNPSSTMSS